MQWALLLALAVGSGACALVYQVLWLRELSLLFGVTIHAAGTVLAVYMGGLALGGVLAPRWLRRHGVALRAFGIAEIAIGATALGSGLLLKAAESAYLAMAPAEGWGLAQQTAVRVVLTAAILGVPTTLMGMTLPVLSTAAVVRASFGPRASLLYASNTAGAIAGCLAAGFLALPEAGARVTLLLAAGTNISVGLIALAAARRESVPDSTGRAAADDDGADESRGSVPMVLVVVMLVSGAAAMGLELAWFRALVQFVPATTYAFTTMLATVLTGLAAGSAVSARIADGREVGVTWLLWLQGATAVTTLASISALGSAYGYGWSEANAVPLSALAILPATFCMGMALPLALRLAVADAGSPSSVAARVGRIYAWNLAGAIAGSLLMGFVLVPWWGVRGSVVAAAAAYVVNAALLARHTRTRVGVAGLLAVTAGLAISMPDPLEAALARRHGADLQPYWREEGAQASVSVRQAPGRRVLFIDGLHQASDNPAMVAIHRQIGHLAMLLHPAPRDVLVIGLGGGATAGATTQYPGARIQVVELSESVHRAASLFSHVNYEVATRPDVRIHREDIRSFLATTRSRFDVVTADIIQPTHAGAGALYSREYFQRVRSRLQPGGLVVQWVGQRERSHYGLIVRTFLDVFPDATAWVGGTLLVGSAGELGVSPSDVAAKLASEPTRRSLATVALTSFADLESWFTADAATLRRFVGPGPVLTDDRPVVEYFRSLPRGEPLVDLSGLRSDVSRFVVP